MSLYSRKPAKHYMIDNIGARIIDEELQKAVSRAGKKITRMIAREESIPTDSEHFAYLSDLIAQHICLYISDKRLTP